ncbi:Gfo/Idh/MocA family oxidoreductase [Clostridium sp. E02]|uniref:Gfo/Idh/MocA family protein n=1 Tax=Clostridium sp. E02 TaxID=2487134 RepID=UPI000F51DBB6|nr:Gfo/Idh/MocA family oxidoreductase [Clostridium sp. E02]
MEILNVGIMGTGNIASVLADTMSHMPQVCLYGAASRDKAKAKLFADRHSVKNAYGSYEELVKDPEISLIYIATPHSEHYNNAKLCLEHGKHVLCEKAFAVNAIQAEEMIQLAQKKNRLITEAMWVRYMPMVETLKKVLDSGSIGEPMTLTANLCYLVSHLPRLTKPELAGGALLDVGVYTLNFASLVFGDEILDITSSVIKTETGVDAQNSMTLTYPGGKMAVLNSSIQALSDRKGIVYGTKGFLVVENINNFESIKVYNTDRKLVDSYIRPEQISGYEYQIEASYEAILNNWNECPQMPHKTTLDIMKVMDSLRKTWGISYPFE